MKNKMKTILFVFFTILMNLLWSQTISFEEYFQKLNTPFFLDNNSFIDSYYTKASKKIPYSIWSTSLFCTNPNYNSIIVNDSAEFDIIPVGYIYVSENDKALIFYFFSKITNYDFNALYIAIFDNNQNCLFIRTLGENSNPNAFVFLNNKWIIGIGCTDCYDDFKSHNLYFIQYYDSIIKEYRLLYFSEISIE